MQREYLERLNETRKNGLDGLITKRLLDARAKKDGITSDELVKREVTNKIPDPSDKDVQSVYDRAKASGRPLPPIEQVKGDIVKYLKSQKQEEAMHAFVARLKADAKVETMLPAYETPPVEVAAVGPSKGPADARVTIVEFSDFQCPYCGRAEPTVDRVLSEYKGKVKLVYREFPLPFHDKAEKASEAALCAEDQGKYWDMHEKLFKNQQALDVPQLKTYASQVGLDVAKFSKCLDSGEKASAVEENKHAGEDVGVTGTPAFFINGHMLSGAQPFDKFKEIIEAELARK